MTIAVQSNYIHYFYEHYNGPKNHMPSLEQAKQQIKKGWLARVKAAQIDINAKNISDDQLIQLLNDISSNGPIGSAMIGALSNIQWDESRTFTEGEGLKGSISTGNADVIGLHAEAPSISKQAQAIISDINAGLQGIIDVMQWAQQPLLVAQLRKVRNGESINTVPGLKNAKINNGKFSKHDLTAAMMDLEKAMTDLSDNINRLKKWSEDGGSADKTLEAIVKSVRGSFNTMGGQFYEVAVKHAANVAGEELRDQLKTVYNLIGKNYPARVGSDLDAIWSGNQKLEGGDIKPDIQLSFSKNNVTFSFGGSIKLAQNAQYAQGKAFQIQLQGSPSLGEGLEQYMNLAGYSANSLQWFEAGLGALKLYSGKKAINFNLKNSNGAYQDLIQQWQDLMEMSKKALFIRALSGSGDMLKESGKILTDTASFLVINNTVYSMYDIICHFLDDTWKGVNLKVDTAPASIAFAKRKSQISRSLQKKAEESGPKYAQTRSEVTKGYITNLYQDLYKIKIAISLAFNGL